MPINIPIVGQDHFSKTFEKIQNNIQKANASIQKSGEDIEQVFKRVASVASTALAGFSAKEFVQKMVQVRGEFQKLEVAFTTMLGNADKANALMQQLTKTAATTPFDLQGVANGAKQLLAYGIEAEKVNDTLIHLGDIAAGLSLPLGDLVYLYGTTMVQGRMFTQDLRQFQGRGIPIAEELAKQFGVAKDKVGELVTAGKVGAKEFNQAIMSMSSEGGKFTGLMEAQSKTITGQIANIEDAIDVMFNNLGKESEGIINGTLDVASSLVENYEKVGKVIASMVTIYGTYKAAVMAVVAIQSLQAAGIGALTAKEAIHYGWLVLVKKAQIALNATMLTNPYVLMATAIAGVVAALILMKSQQELVAEAQQRYNDEKDEAIRKEEEHKNKIEELVRIAGDETLSTENRRLALVQLEQQYPSIFAKYDTEAEKLSHILDIKNAIAEADGKKSITLPQNELASVNKRIQELEEKGEAVYKTTTLATGATFATQIGGRTKEDEAELINLQNRRKELNKQVQKGRADAYLADLTGVSNEELQRQIDTRKNLLAQMKMQGKKYGKVISGGATGTYTADELLGQQQIFEAEQKKRSEKMLTPAQQKAALLKNLQAAQKALKDFDASSTKYTTAEAEKKRKELSDAVELAEKEYKKFGGSTSSKGASKAEQNQKAYESKQKELAKERERLEAQLSQSFVDIEEDISARELSQLQHDHNQEMAELKRQKNEYIDSKIELEKAKAKAEGKTYTEPTDKTKVLSLEEVEMFSALQSNLLRKQEAETEDFYKQEADAMRDYLHEYGTYQQQKLAIAEDYAERIKKAETEGERLSLEKERDKRIGEVNLDAIKQTIDWASVFGDFSSMFQSEMEHNIDAIREYMKSDEFKNMNPTDQAQIVDALNRLKEHAGGSLSDVDLKKVGELTSQFQTAQQALTKAKEDEENAYQRLNKAQAGYDAAFSTGNKVLIDTAKTELESAKSYATGMSEVYQNAEANFTATANNLKDATEKAVDGINAVSNAVSQIKSGSLQGAYEGIKNLSGALSGEATKGIGKVLGSISKAMGSGIGEIISAALGLLDLLKEGIGSIIADLSDMVFNAVNGVLSDALSGDIIAKPLKSVVDGAGKVISTISFGATDKLFGENMSKIWGGSNDNFEAAIKKWGWMLDTWKENLEYEKDLMNKAYGTDVLDIRDKTEEDLRKTQQAAREVYEAWAGDGGGWNSHSHGYNANRDAVWQYLWDYNEGLGRKAGMEGRDWRGSLSELINNLTADELEQIKNENGQFWSTIDDTAKEYIQTIIDAEKAIEELNESAVQQLTDLSLSTLESQFTDMITNWDDETEDFAEDFEGYLKKAIMKSLMVKTYSKELEAWRKKFSDAMGDDGKIDTKEAGNLRTELQGILNRGRAQYEEMMNAAGLDASSTSKDQQATANMADKATYDQFELYLGIATAQQIALEQGKQEAFEQRNVIISSLQSMQAATAARGLVVGEIRSLIETTNNYLLDIKMSNRQILSDFGERLDKVIDILDDIR